MGDRARERWAPVRGHSPDRYETCGAHQGEVAVVEEEEEEEHRGGPGPPSLTLLVETRSVPTWMDPDAVLMEYNARELLLLLLPPEPSTAYRDPLHSPLLLLTRLPLHPDNPEPSRRTPAC